FHYKKSCNPSTRTPDRGPLNSINAPAVPSWKEPEFTYRYPAPDKYGRMWQEVKVSQDIYAACPSCRSSDPPFEPPLNAAELRQTLATSHSWASPPFCGKLTTGPFFDWRITAKKRWFRN